MALQIGGQYIRISFGESDLDEAMQSASLPPKTLSSCEASKILACIGWVLRLISPTPQRMLTTLRLESWPVMSARERYKTGYKLWV